MVARKLVYIAGPNEVLVFSGRASRGPKGKPRGYRTIKGGRGFRMPLIEEVDRVDLTNMVIDVAVTNAYSKGGIPLNVHAIANVKVSSGSARVKNAIERFMGRDPMEIHRVAKEVFAAKGAKVVPKGRGAASTRNAHPLGTDSNLKLDLPWCQIVKNTLLVTAHLRWFTGIFAS